MLGEHRHSASYLLRLWRVESEGKLIWRASLHHSDTGERRGFASVGDLLRFLEAQYGLVGGAAADTQADTVQGRRILQDVFATRGTWC